jgi:antitoxin PrlF
MPVFKSKVTSKGQITIPQEVRRRLGLKQGDEVEFETGAAETVIRPAHKRGKGGPFDEWVGIAKGAFPGGMKEINAWIREMRGDWDQD